MRENPCSGSNVYSPHPFSQIFPVRMDDSLTELSDNIKEKGLKEDIVLHQGRVLDGNRRQAACIRAGVAPRYRNFGSRPGDGTDPLEFVFSLNYYRRELSRAERALAAQAYATFRVGDNQYSEGPPIGGPSPTKEQAAKKFDVSKRDVERAKVVADRGVPELVEAMRTEKVSISDAAAIAGEAPEVQRKAIEAVKKGQASTLAGAVAATQPREKAEDPAKIARELEQILERLPRVVTISTEARDLAADGLRRVLALVQRL